ncbi:hypothetical protein ABTQ33_13225 (plasmid) [Paucilactobacillus suebicus]|uniref:Uncharacterized protein n=1 Tax=Paucilactobacillus suebicus DSM 5007 = KCTC 3549 TaxID=1423807 RepID=A0A0R1W1V8_9LACO|nr:hypothetical protein [Paucilactobacillus suebicus]KRM09190.1 hypothetical protein FD16_GL001908 [Paucilactobacillus suebicus DSM 5007 = KCTC 3549]
MKKTEVLTGIKSFDKATYEKGKPGVILVLENGNELEQYVKAVQRKIDDLRYALDQIQSFEPEFNVVGSRTAERSDGQRFDVSIQRGKNIPSNANSSMSDIEGYLNHMSSIDTITIKLS